MTRSQSSASSEPLSLSALRPADATVAYRFPAARADEVWRRLAERLLVLEEALASERFVLDTFDRLLAADGWRLEMRSETSGSRLEASSVDGGVHRSVATENAPRDASDLPSGEVWRQLAERVAPRRLLVWARVERRAVVLRVLDDERKTVARIWRLETRASLPPELATLLGRSATEVDLEPRLELRPVRGYGDELDSVRAVLAELELEPAPADPAATALEALDLPHATSETAVVDPHQTAADATRSVLRAQLATLRAQEIGTRLDIDSEFLHDFRVAIRRTRSILGQIRGVFAPDLVEHFKSEWRWLGQATGPTRDLDVYLLKMPSYRRALPPEAQDALDPLETYLRRRQREEQEKVRAVLESSRYRRLLEDWARWLGAPESERDAEDGGENAPPNADRPAREVVARRIWKLYRRLLRDGGAIDDETPDEAVHDLRILAKKLRYTMELFRDLFPAAKLDAAVRDLKRLQRNLGDFNDYSVQRESLRRMALELEGAPPETLLAMGQLLAGLERGQAEERRAVEKRVAVFSTPRRRRRYRALFGP
ncbi:MAG: CHAD domain-containing protein [Acidobacteriota bacterium]